MVNSLFFLNVFDNGGLRAESKRCSWLTAAGFKNIERFPRDSWPGLMVAEKA